MYAILLALHSFLRWFVLISLLTASLHAYRSWKRGKVYTKRDDALRQWTKSIAEIQMTIGLTVYYLSPLTTYFRNNFDEAVHNRELRFFGMEHSLMMLVAVILVSVGSSLTKQKQTDRQKFKTMAIWFISALLLILLNIPWQFSPLVSRPYCRVF